MECSLNPLYKKIKANWDSIAKPLDSMGKFEDITARIGYIQETENPHVSKSALIVLCADNGIVEEGVSQSGQEVTRVCAQNIAAGKSVAGLLAKSSETRVITVDLGINCEDEIPEVLNRKIRRGTRNFMKEPAMTEAECRAAMETGEKLVKICKSIGYDILCIGEMGIGNTTTSAVVAAALLGLEAKQVCGRGAGLSDAGLKRKREVVQTALEKYSLRAKPVMEVLRTAGGFDIAGMAGICLGAKKHRIPVVLDGAISLVAALAASRIDEDICDYLIASHRSREPLAQTVLDALGLDAVIDADMALGEGSGAVMMMSLLKAALSVYDNALRFDKSGVEQYIRFDTDSALEKEHD